MVGSKINRASFKAAGYVTIKKLSGALPEEELIAAIKNVHLLGIRSKTQVTKKVLAAAEAEATKLRAGADAEALSHRAFARRGTQTGRQLLGDAGQRARRPAQLAGDHPAEIAGSDIAHAPM